MNALALLGVLARYQTHPGYAWAAVMRDGELICERCASEPGNYRIMRSATAHPGTDPQWEVIGLTHSGEAEESAQCAHCLRVMWEVES